jgi:uncharacterized integral membrane protein
VITAPGAPGEVGVDVMTGIIGWPVFAVLFDGFTTWDEWPCVLAALAVAVVGVMVMRGPGGSNHHRGG